MIKILLVIVFALSSSIQKVRSQRIFEFGIKPTELLFLNIEGYAGIGNAKNRYGVLFSWRPSTQDSGLIKSAGSGAAGGYGQNHFNKLYHSYTAGLFWKKYINPKATFFIEADIFYRNWSFQNKKAEFRNAEGYRFNGLRTENVDVYCLKLLAGKTFFLTNKKGKLSPYLDIYIGVAIRYKDETYETFNGWVYDIFYNYKKDEFNKTIPTPQLGVKIGLMKTN